MRVQPMSWGIVFRGLDLGDDEEGWRGQVHAQELTALKDRRRMTWCNLANDEEEPLEAY